MLSHKTIEKCPNLTCIIATDHIICPCDCEKATNPTAFHKTTRRCDIIGAILDYRNHLHVEWTMDYGRNHYCSILF